MSRVVYFEVYVQDPKRAITFYHSVFGWHIKKSKSIKNNLWLVNTGSPSEPGINGALVLRSIDAQLFKTNFVCSISVSSIDEYIIRIQNHGGNVVSPRIRLPDLGSIAYCSDTEGNTFGIIEKS